MADTTLEIMETAHDHFAVGGAVWEFARDEIVRDNEHVRAMAKEVGFEIKTLDNGLLSGDPDMVKEATEELRAIRRMWNFITTAPKGECLEYARCDDEGKYVSEKVEVEL